MSRKPLISRDELLGGALKGRRQRSAQSVLALIEAKTAQLSREAEVTLAPEFGSASATARTADYFKTLASSDGSAVTTIHELERFAPQWASLVPQSADIRAATLKQLFDKYQVPLSRTPRLQGALGATDLGVMKAFEAQTSGALADAFADTLSLRDRFAWRRAAITETFETLPPFWTAFALTANTMFGPSILAMPIAFAGLGPLLGVAVLIFLAGVNALTYGYLSEACARNSGIARGSGTIGSLAANYLGPVPAKALQIALFVFCALVVFVIFVGFGAAASQMTGLYEGLCVGLIFAVVAFVLTRKTLHLTITSGLIVGAINVAMLTIMMALVLFSTPLDVFGQTFAATDISVLTEPSTLTLVFGITLYALCAQTAVTNCAQTVLKADPSGRSLARGSIAGFVFSVVFFCAWILVVNGALPAEDILQESSTALGPMAERAGVQIQVFGAVFILLAFGTSAIANGLGVINMGREILEDYLNRGSGDTGPTRVRDADFTGRMSGVLSLPKEERRVLTHIMRSDPMGTAPPEGMTARAYQEAIHTLQSQGLLTQSADGFHAQAMLRVPKAASSVTDRTFSRTGRATEKAQHDPSTTPAKRRIQSQLLLAIPLLLIFLAVQVLYALDLVSFTSALNTVGVLLAPLIAGVFPCLLFKAARNAGRDVSWRMGRFWGSWTAVFLVWGLSLASYLVHALVLWDAPAKQVLALVFGAAVLVLILIVALRGAFRPTLLIEVFDDRVRGHGILYSFTRAGQPLSLPHRITTKAGVTTTHVASEGNLEHVDGVQELAIDTFKDTNQVRISTQTVSAEGELSPTPTWLALGTKRGPLLLDLSRRNGQVKATFGRSAERLGLRFPT